MVIVSVTLMIIIIIFIIIYQCYKAKPNHIEPSETHIKTNKTINDIGEETSDLDSEDSSEDEDIKWFNLIYILFIYTFLLFILVIG